VVSKDQGRKGEIAAQPSAAPKKRLDPWSKDVGAVPRTAQQARSGIGPYEIKGVSFIDNPDPKSGSGAPKKQLPRFPSLDGRG